MKFSAELDRHIAIYFLDAVNHFMFVNACMLGATNLHVCLQVNKNEDLYYHAFSSD